MTCVNTGNFQSTRFKLGLGHSTLGNKGCIHPGKSSTTLGFVPQRWSSLPPSWPLGLTPQPSACSQAMLTAILFFVCSAAFPSSHSCSLAGRLSQSMVPLSPCFCSVPVQPLHPTPSAC